MNQARRFGNICQRFGWAAWRMCQSRSDLGSGEAARKGPRVCFIRRSPMSRTVVVSTNATEKATSSVQNCEQ